MKASTEVAFELKTVLIPIVAISPKAEFTPEIRKSRKYRQIAASIEHVGLIEPLIVSPVSDGTFLLLDGALRLDILKERQNETVRCILSTDDEGYTYNKRVSHLSNIGEHYMILKALSNGVSEQMISTSLNVDVETKEIVARWHMPRSNSATYNSKSLSTRLWFSAADEASGTDPSGGENDSRQQLLRDNGEDPVNHYEARTHRSASENEPGKSRRRRQTLSSSRGVGYAAHGCQAGGRDLCDTGT